MKPARLYLGAAFLAAVVWAQSCPVVDVSNLPSQTWLEDFESYPADQPPPSPCWDTLWPAGYVDPNYGWVVRTLPNNSDIGSPPNTKALRIGYFENGSPLDSAHILQGPQFNLVPLRKYALSYRWYWSSDPGCVGFACPSPPAGDELYIFAWKFVGNNPLIVREDTLSGDALTMNWLFGEFISMGDGIFRYPVGASSPAQLVVEAYAIKPTGGSYITIDSIRLVQLPNNLAFLVSASYSGGGTALIDVRRSPDSTNATTQDSIIIVLPCDTPLSNVTGFSVELAPGATLNPASIDGDYSTPDANGDHTRTFTMTAEDGSLSRTLVVQVIPRWTPSVTIVQDPNNAALLSVQNPSPNHSYQWQKRAGNSWNDIPGETRTSFTAQANGMYRVRVDSAGCVGYSNQITITTSALSLSTSAQVAIYPNPTYGEVSLVSASPMTDLALYTTDGKLLHRWKSTSSFMRLDLSHLPTGLYLLKISTSAGETKTLIQRL